MRAFYLGGAIDDRAPQPTPSAGELLIRVHAAGVIAAEPGWYPSLHRKDGGPRARAVPCHEFSGVVAEAGEGVEWPARGAEVFGMNDWFADGALAEYCVAPASSVAVKPPGLRHTEAAAMPISSLTAWEGLFGRASLQAGERVLVHGGAGAVGTFAVQLAHIHGAHVTATASAQNLEFVKSIGADEAVDYRDSPFDRIRRDMDVVFDTVGGETLERSWDVLGAHGRMVTVVSTAENSIDERVKAAFFIVQANGKQLAEIGELAEAGTLKVEIDSVIPFGRAREVFEPGMARRGRGKVVVEFSA